MARILHWPAFVQTRIDRLLRPAAPAAPGAVTVLAQRDIYILPTRHGLLFAAVLLAMLLGALNYNNSLGLMLTFLLASLAIISILHGYRNLAGLRIEGVRAEPAFAGQEAQFRLALHNPSATARRALTLTPAGGAPRTVDLPAGQRSVIALPVPAAQRGRLEFGKLTLASRYPLGLFRVWAYWRPASYATVYPRPALPQPLPVGRGREGEGRDAALRGSDDFRGFRDYRYGDNLRQVHWKALARGQGLQVKQFADPQSTALWLGWEATVGPDTEARLSQLCRWVLEAQRLGLPFGLRLPDGELPPAGDEGQVQRALTRLAFYGLP